MRKFYTIALLALATVGSSAMAANNVKKQHSSAPRLAIESAKAEVATPAKVSALAWGDDMGATIKNPAGTDLGFTREVLGFVPDGNGGQKAFEACGYEAIVRESVNGDSIYFKNPISSFPMGSWIGGKKLADGSVSFSMPQTLYDLGVTKFVVCVMREDANGKIGVDSTLTEVTFKLENGHYIYDQTESDLYLGIYQTRDKQIDGYTDYYIDYTPFDDVRPEVPEEWERYLFTAKDYQGNDIKQYTNVAIDGNDVYVKQLPGVRNMDLAIKGRIEGDKAIFPNHQYLGQQYSQHVWMTNGRLNEQDGEYYIYDNNEDLVFNYDAETKSMTQANGCIFWNGSKTDLYVLDILQEPEINPLPDIEAVPQLPIVYEAQPYDEYNDYGVLDFEIPSVDAKGNVLNPDKLFFVVYDAKTDDPEDLTPHVFDSSRFYYGLDDDMEEFPFNFYDGVHFLASENSAEGIMLLFPEELNPIGLQAIYRGGGKEHKSGTVWIEFDENGDANIYSAVRDVKTVGEGEPVYYDIAGRAYSKPQSGLNIVRYPNGVVKKIVK